MLDGDAGDTLGLCHRLDDLVDVQLLTRNVGYVAALADKLDQRRSIVKARDSYHVVDVVTVQPARRGDNEIVARSFLDFGAGEQGWRSAADFRFRNELVEISVDCEDAGGTRVGNRQSHLRLACTIAEGAHRPFAQPAGEFIQSHANGSAFPTADQLKSAPIFFGPEGSVVL